MELQNFLTRIATWAAEQRDIQGVILVGSYARGTARPDSDVDLVILTVEPERYINSCAFAEKFGAISQWQKEDWGAVTSMRVWYQDGLEVEYGITLPSWAALPLDPGTLQVVSDGMQIIFDREGSLKSNLSAASGHA